MRMDRDMQLQIAMAALKRIERKQGGYTHIEHGQTCDCPACIAKSALEQIMDLQPRPEPSRAKGSK